jgi:DNA modification methylase
VTPHYADEQVTLYAGDCLDVLRELPDASVDAVCTDPPYGLGFMGREWDSISAAHLPPSAQPLDSPLARYRTGKGPAAVAFDGIAFQSWCEQWAAECLRVLKPGGHLLAFGGTRTWHRLACAIEDAGFEVRDSIAWLYGSGFPKSLDVSKAIDKRGGNPHLADEIGAAIKAARESRGWTTGQADRHFCGGTTNWTWYEGRKGMCRPPTPADFARIVAEWPELAPVAAKVAEAEREITRGATREAVAGDTISFDQRSSTERERRDVAALPVARTWQGWGTALKPAHEPIVVARKPLVGTVAANVLAHGTGALNIDGCRVEGDKGWPATRSYASGNHYRGLGGTQYEAHTVETAEPTAGRWPANVVLDPDAAGELDRQSGNVRAGGHVTTSDGAEGTANIGPTGLRRGQAIPGVNTYSDTGGASRFFYVAKAPTAERPRADLVAHPTVKPLDLMRWLVRLVTPPGGVVLDPFAGSGTTAEACVLEHMRCITIEREADYLPLIVARLSKPLQVGFDFDGGDAA